MLQEEEEKMLQVQEKKVLQIRMVIKTYEFFPINTLTSLTWFKFFINNFLEIQD